MRKTASSITLICALIAPTQVHPVEAETYKKILPWSIAATILSGIGTIVCYKKEKSASNPKSINRWRIAKKVFGGVTAISAGTTALCWTNFSEPDREPDREPDKKDNNLVETKLDEEELAEETRIANEAILSKIVEDMRDKHIPRVRRKQKEASHFKKEANHLQEEYYKDQQELFQFILDHKEGGGPEATERQDRLNKLFDEKENKKERLRSLEEMEIEKLLADRYLVEIENLQNAPGYDEAAAAIKKFKKIVK